MAHDAEAETGAKGKQRPRCQGRPFHAGSINSEILWNWVIQVSRGRENAAPI